MTVLVVCAVVLILGCLVFIAVPRSWPLVLLVAVLITIPLALVIPDFSLGLAGATPRTIDPNKTLYGSSEEWEGSGKDKIFGETDTENGIAVFKVIPPTQPNDPPVQDADQVAELLRREKELQQANARFEKELMQAQVELDRKSREFVALSESHQITARYLESERAQRVSLTQAKKDAVGWSSCSDESNTIVVQRPSPQVQTACYCCAPPQELVCQ